MTQPPNYPPPGQYPPPPADYPPPGYWPPPPEKNGLGITALILGIIGLLFCLIPLTGFVGFILGVIGFILGLVGWSRIRKQTATNRKTTISGIALSALAIAGGIWGMVIVFTATDQFFNDVEKIGNDLQTSLSSIPDFPTTTITAAPSPAALPTTSAAAEETTDSAPAASTAATAVPQPGDCDIVTDGVSPPRCTAPGEKVVDHCASPATGERGTTYYTDGTTGWTQQCANLWDMEKRPTTQQGSGLTLESCTDANEGDVTTSSKGTLVCRNGQWTIQ